MLIKAIQNEIKTNTSRKLSEYTVNVNTISFFIFKELQEIKFIHI